MVGETRTYYVYRIVQGVHQYMDQHGRWVDPIRQANLFYSREAALYVVDAYREHGAQLGWV